MDGFDLLRNWISVNNVTSHNCLGVLTFQISVLEYCYEGNVILNISDISIGVLVMKRM